MVAMRSWKVWKRKRLGADLLLARGCCLGLGLGVLGFLVAVVGRLAGLAPAGAVGADRFAISSQEFALEYDPGQLHTHPGIKLGQHHTNNNNNTS